MLLLYPLLVVAMVNLITQFYTKLQVSALSAKQGTLLREAKDLKVQAKALETPDTFAQAAKLQRKAIKAEKEAAGLSERAQALIASKTMRRVRQLRMAAGIVASLAFWGQPLASVEPALLAPLGRWVGIGLPAALRAGGSVGMMGYLFLCDTACGALCRALADTLAPWLILK